MLKNSIKEECTVLHLMFIPVMHIHYFSRRSLNVIVICVIPGDYCDSR